MVVHAPGFSNGNFCESFLWKTGIVDGWLFEKFQSGRVIDSKSSFPTLNICETEPGLPHWLISNISSTPTILKDPNKNQAFVSNFLPSCVFLKMISYPIAFRVDTSQGYETSRARPIDQILPQLGVRDVSEKTAESFRPRESDIFPKQLHNSFNKSKKTSRPSWLNHFDSKHFL